MMNPVVVIGGSHHNTLGVVRALGRKGLSEALYVVLVGDKSSYVLKSKYILKGHSVVIADDSELVNALLHLKISEEKAVVICSSDPSIAFLDRHREELQNKFILPNANSRAGEIARLMNKFVQTEYAIESGLQIPEGCIYSKRGGGDGTDKLEKWNVFPCIIKPIDSVSGGKSDIHICNNREELLSDLAQSECSEFQIQRYIDKTMEFQLIGCSLKGGKEVIIPGYTDIIRQPANTNTGFLQYVPMDDTINQVTLSGVEKFLIMIGYSGLFSVEFLKDKMGNDFFLEINMRNDGNAICVTDAGMNLPFIWYAFNSGLDYKSEAANPIHQIIVMPEIDDIVNVLKHKISFKSWLKDVKQTDTFMEYSCDDKKPFIKRISQFTWFLIKKTIHLC